MDSADRILWRRSCMIEVAEDECARFLDLAAFAEGRLDPDERERVAEWLRSHKEAGDDIDAARALANGGPREALGSEAPWQEAPWQEALSETAMARACALVGGVASGRRGSVVPFRPRAGRRPVLGPIAQWGSLAAALVVAGWLGFTLGVDTSGMLAPSGGPVLDDGIAQDLFGSSPAFLRDMTGGA